ncbi:Prefoldin subunit 6 [Sarcoptes scabiei]|uniref:Probable prefoldin subunit 6 n=1 Tax=Sarcoptes scabiei TaxID=52283 RepID=A0A834VFX3_SARSC|nr:Prefoldin subunit 6 [Sarcoptes scabiei]UXI21563.1 thrombospondin [Sarcoptes scabiei]
MEMKKFNDQYQKFQESRNQIKKLIGQRGQLEVQLNENKIVKEELELLDDNVRTFKLIGPALMKIDLKEAKDNVNNRIKYINQELKRHEQSIETLMKQQEEHKNAVLEIEKELRAKGAAYS